jgi:hypothetical protein
MKRPSTVLVMISSNAPYGVEGKLGIKIKWRLRGKMG